MKSREEVTTNGRAVFYASMYNDLKNVALDYGWALGIHGSLASDMDIMAMPWTENAKPIEEMIKALSNCFDKSPFKDLYTVSNMPNNRVVYTMPIWADFYLDINVIKTDLVEKV